MLLLKNQVLGEKHKRGLSKAVFSQKIKLVSKPTKWEKCKMSDVISLQSGQDFAPSDYNDVCDGVPYMTGASCIVDRETVVSRWTTKPRCIAHKNDTLLVCKGSGSGAVVRLSQDTVHIARQFMSLQCHSSMTKEFCFYLTHNLSDKMKQSATGLIEGIDRKTVLEQEILLPPISEQSVIVQFFSLIDKTVSNHENSRKNLCSLKSGLLQQLFI